MLIRFSEQRNGIASWLAYAKKIEFFAPVTGFTVCMRKVVQSPIIANGDRISGGMERNT